MSDLLFYLFIINVIFFFLCISFNFFISTLVLVILVNQVKLNGHEKCNVPLATN